MRKYLTVEYIVTTVGIGSLVYGISLWSHAAAFTVGGVLGIAIGLLSATAKRYGKV